MLQGVNFSLKRKLKRGIVARRHNCNKLETLVIINILKFEHFSCRKLIHWFHQRNEDHLYEVNIYDSAACNKKSNSIFNNFKVAGKRND